MLNHTAWKDFANLIQLPSSFNDDDFTSFVATGNHVGRILNLHMFLLEYLLGQFCLKPSDAPKLQGRKQIILRWTQDIAQNVASGLKECMQWPLGFCETLMRWDSRYLLSP